MYAPEPVCTVVIASTAPCSTGSPITSALRYTAIGSYGHGGAYRAFTQADPEKDLISIVLYQRSNVGGDMPEEISAFLQMAAAAIK